MAQSENLRQRVWSQLTNNHGSFLAVMDPDGVADLLVCLRRGIHLIGRVACNHVVDIALSERVAALATPSTVYAFSTTSPATRWTRNIRGADSVKLVVRKALS
ncbi:uncharacterized protein LOC142567776 [Dermacentor variabilis]|uniref:uncharacterized protein LOC142567776 n=1 Tax=Dermacentor variabilis TaxID=34621 RepID=UPI003F5CAF79